MNSETLSVVIIDDEPRAIEYLRIMLEKMAGVKVVAGISDPQLAVATLLRLQPHLLMLDIQMPVITGFDVLKQLKMNGLKPYTIFVTAFDQYAIQAIKAGAFDYLLKPVDPDELAEAIAKVKSDYPQHNLEHRLELLENELNSHRKIRFNTRSAYILLHPVEIMYIEADANYSEIYLSKQKREVVSMNLGAVEAMLPKQFIRISRSVIINSDYLVKVSGVNKRCKLKKDEEEIEFTIPEKQMAELKRAIGEL
jgi:two-component system LytT family response regulator